MSSVKVHVDHNNQRVDRVINQLDCTEFRHVFASRYALAGLHRGI